MVFTSWAPRVVDGREVFVGRDRFYAFDGDFTEVDVGFVLTATLASFAYCDDYFFANHGGWVEYHAVGGASSGGRIDAAWESVAVTPDCGVVVGLSVEFRPGHRTVARGERGAGYAVDEWTIPDGLTIVELGDVYALVRNGDGTLRWRDVSSELEGRRPAEGGRLPRTPSGRVTVVATSEASLFLGTDAGELLRFTPSPTRRLADTQLLHTPTIPGADPSDFGDAEVVGIRAAVTRFESLVYATRDALGTWDGVSACVPQRLPLDLTEGGVRGLVRIDDERLGVLVDDAVHVMRAEASR